VIGSQKRLPRINADERESERPKKGRFTTDLTLMTLIGKRKGSTRKGSTTDKHRER
jgi:hypothetical protein